MNKTSILTVTALGVRKDWLLETAESIKIEKNNGIQIEWLLCVRGDEKIPHQIKMIADLIIRVPIDYHVADSRNKLLSYVTTEYVNTLDDDDILISGGLSLRMAMLNKNPRLGWVAGYMHDMDDKGQLGDVWEQPATHGKYKAGDLMNIWGSPDNWFVCISHSFLMRTEIVKKLGGWQKVSQEDILLVCQVSSLYDGHILEFPMIGYRRHEHQISRSVDEINERQNISQSIFDKILNSKKN